MLFQTLRISSVNIRGEMSTGFDYFDLVRLSRNLRINLNLISSLHTTFKINKFLVINVNADTSIS